MPLFPGDMTGDVGEEEESIRLLIEISEEKKGRKLTEEEIHKIIHDQTTSFE